MSTASEKLRSIVVAIVAAAVGYAAAAWPAASLSPAGNRPPAGDSARLLSNGKPPLQLSSESIASLDNDSAASAESQLAAAAHEPDFFRAAAQALGAIDRLTAADFAASSARGKLPQGLSGDPSNDLAADLAGAFVERWLAVDPEGAIPALYALAPEQEEDFQQDKKDTTHALRIAMAQHDPSAFLALEKVLKSRSDPYVSSPWEIAYAALAARNLPAARQLAADLPPDAREVAESAILLGLAEVDSPTAVRLARRDSKSDRIYDAALASAERAGPGVVREVVAAADRDFFTTNREARLRLRYPELEFTGAALDPGRSEFGSDPTTVLSALSAEEVQDRVARLDRFPPVFAKKIAPSLVSAWAGEAPEEATRWAQARLADFGDAPVSAAFTAWLKADSSAALMWRQTLPESPLKSTLTTLAARELVAQKQIAVALELRNGAPVSNEFESYYRLMFSDSVLIRDPARGTPWVAAQPVDRYTPALLREGLGSWLALDPSAARQWVESLPPSLPRDAAAATLSARYAAGDLASAAPWLDTIADPARRAEAVREAYRTRDAHDPSAARAWLQTRADLAPAEREHLLRHPR